MEQEIWVTASRHENYEVSNMGQIRRKINQRILKTQIASNGYVVVSIWTNKRKYTRNIARIVWESFNDCACGFTIDHIDRNKKNNILKNLRCITMEDNWKNRSIYKRENKYDLNDDKRKTIITNILVNNWTTFKVWKEYGIPTNYMDSVVKRGSWNYLIDEPNRV
jgi:hypothetical protein